MRFILRLMAIFLTISGIVLAQSCPVRRQPKHVDSGFEDGLDPSARQTITGTIVYHENLRNWFGIQPEAAICGQTEFEIWAPDAPQHFVEMKKTLERSRDCKAAISGRLVFGNPEENAREIVLQMDQVVPNTACVLKPELPDNSKLKPKASVNRYNVTMTVSLVGDGSVQVGVRDQSQRLHPWQAYMTYRLENQHTFSATCGYGFVVGDVSSKPDGAFKMVDSPTWDIRPFSGSISPLVMTYTCTRVVPPGH